MATSDPDPDPRLARFRRDAGTTAAPAAPPPVVPQYAADASAGDQAVPRAADPELFRFAAPSGAEPLSAETFSAQPSAVQTSVGQVGPESWGPPPSSEPEAVPLYETPSYEWMPVDTDPGRATGIASIAVGVFVGIVGLFMGVHSIRKSRRVGLAGTVGIVGVIVSCLSILLFGGIILSWVRYEVELAQQCSLVGPGRYYTSSGDVVTCH